MIKLPPKSSQDLEENDFYLTELRLLIPNLDYEALLKLKSQDSISKEDLTLCGDIVLSSWRAYC